MGWTNNDRTDAAAVANIILVRMMIEIVASGALPRNRLPTRSQFETSYPYTVVVSFLFSTMVIYPLYRDNGQ